MGTFTDSTTQVDMQKIANAFQGNPGHDVDSYFSESVAQGVAHPDVRSLSDFPHPFNQ